MLFLYPEADIFYQISADTAMPFPLRPDTAIPFPYLESDIFTKSVGRTRQCRFPTIPPAQPRQLSILIPTVSKKPGYQPKFSGVLASVAGTMGWKTTITSKSVSLIPLGICKCNIPSEPTRDRTLIICITLASLTLY